MFDECTAFKGEHELRLDEIVSKLIADGKVPPLTVVGIDSTSARNDEYALYTNPVTEAGIGGTSLGAAAALYTSVQRPDLFGLALLESPSLLLGNGQFLRDTAFIARAPDRVAVGVGATEHDFPDIDQYFAPYRLKRGEAEAGIVKMTEELATNLITARIKRSEVMLVVAPKGRHDSASWSARIPDAIMLLFSALQ